MALQGPALLALGNVSKDFVLQLVCRAVGDPVGREELSGQSRTPAWDSAALPAHQQALLTT